MTLSAWQHLNTYCLRCEIWISQRLVLFGSSSSARVIRHENSFVNTKTNAIFGLTVMSHKTSLKQH